MNCKKCNEEIPLVVNYENGFAKLWYCSKCDFEEREITECEHEFVTLKYEYSSTLINVMTKCTKCDKFLKAHKHRDVDLSNLNSKNLEEGFEYQDRLKEIRILFAKKINELRLEQKKLTNEWSIQQWYYGYLQSNIWKKKREWVLKNVDYKCERCGKKALLVHHKTYDRVGYENPEDLMAVCKSCHGKEHSENRDLDIVSQFKLDNNI
ncbi:HNH endonuclease [Lacinutrix venerupis]|uniref:HNH nuclease domain-containing protein n=1 Tax=Lacinutrix venerupis TaxID=1486034 RepID=A0AAC9LL81_9FLAO|nr:HNH endonuclease [Lacinutrix venerupis]APX99464.1 hypothetical protein BWR22_03770 [Lacinutrix venerupis]